MGVVIVAASAVLVLIGRHSPGSPAFPLPTRSATTSPTAPTQAPPTAAFQGAPHVMVIIEENRGYAATLGSCAADPYFCSLAARYASDTSWYGIAHPSAPNYLAIDSGSTQGVASDCTPDGGGCGPFAGPDLGTQLSSAGIPWVAYMESMPAACDRVSSSSAYAEKHDPFMYFAGNRGSGCSTHVVPYPGMRGMLHVLDSPNPPDFVWITPNLENDMHDGSVTRGDAWLVANLPAVLASRWLADDGTVIVTMDENDGSPSGSSCADAHGGQVPMVVISARAQGRGRIVIPGDHYGTLRSIEAVFGLRLLGNAARPGNGDLTSLFG
jgi:phosphatidylinositol-3-phosphatase